MARACPSVNRPSATASRTASRISSSRSVFAIVLRARPESGRELVLCERELVEQLSKREGFLDRVEVLAQEVLDEGQFELVAIGELPDHGGNPLETGELGGAQPPLTRDELVAVEQLSSTRIGWITPCVRTLSASCASASSSTRLRG